jgi:hypothetical protein
MEKLWKIFHNWSIATHAPILTSERHVAAPLEAFVAGIAADQRAGLGQAVGTASDELGGRVGLGCLSALVLVEAALP